MHFFNPTSAIAAALSGEDEEKRKEIEEALREIGSPMQRDKIDMPEGTMVTDPYYVDRLSGQKDCHVEIIIIMVFLDIS